MDTACRPRWRNCALTTDAEMLSIDAMEDALVPLEAGVEAVRELISSLELCHHKAERWVHNILEAIGAGGSTKGLGTRDSGQLHAAEQVWSAACDALSAWCAGCPADSITGTVGGTPASGLIRRVGDRSPLKEWQVARVIEKIRSLIHFPPPSDEPSAGFAWLLFDDETEGSTFRTECPERYREHESFWQATVRTLIRDSQDRRDPPLSLGLAIDMLWPCHWDFVNNLRLVLDAIGGDLEPGSPFAACGRNIGRLPDRDRYERIARQLGEFNTDTTTAGEVATLLGDPTPEKRWLAASLDKTIRLQLDAPSDVRAICALVGPSWIREGGPTPDVGRACP
jgi:hypothetical protein